MCEFRARHSTKISIGTSWPPLWQAFPTLTAWCWRRNAGRVDPGCCGQRWVRRKPGRAVGQHQIHHSGPPPLPRTGCEWNIAGTSATNGSEGSLAANAASGGGGFGGAGSGGGSSLEDPLATPTPSFTPVTAPTSTPVLAPISALPLSHPDAYPRPHTLPGTDADAGAG